MGVWSADPSRGWCGDKVTPVDGISTCDMLFLTKRLPVTNEEDVAEALAPLLAYYELFEPHPEPAVLLRGRKRDPIVCIPAEGVVETRMFDHPELAAGVRVAMTEDLVGTTVLVTKSLTLVLEFLARDLSRTKEGNATLLAGLVRKKVHCILLNESRCEGFMRRGYPYREPSDVLRSWGLKPPRDCTCMRTKCEVCLVRRWEAVTTMRKHRTALPPGSASICYRFRSPPQGTVFMAAVHPFGWVRDGRISRASIW